MPSRSSSEAVITDPITQTTSELQIEIHTTTKDESTQSLIDKTGSDVVSDIFQPKHMIKVGPETAENLPAKTSEQIVENTNNAKPIITVLNTEDTAMTNQYYLDSTTKESSFVIDHVLQIVLICADFFLIGFVVYLAMN